MPINVRIGNPTNPKTTSTTIFQGAITANVQSEINSILAIAQTAENIANSAYSLAANSLPITGGEITGNLIVDQTFTAAVDGGRF
jgi:hypothetical protein